MYAITGITGQVGGAVANTLLASGQSIRAVVRDASKAQKWAQAGAEIAFADFNDVAALTAAFTGVEGVFIMIPPYFAPSPDFREARANIEALRAALEAAKPTKIVALSSVGAQHDSGLGLINQLYLLEQSFKELPMPKAFIRAAWFMENSLWDIASAKETGSIDSYLAPLDQPYRMVATADIGRISAEILEQSWAGQRIIEIEGPKPYSQHEIAVIFADLLGQPVQAVAVPHDQWATKFAAPGVAPETTALRLEMIDGFNSGWIDFEGGATEHIIGEVPLEKVLAAGIN